MAPHIHLEAALNSGNLGRIHAALKRIGIHGDRLPEAELPRVVQLAIERLKRRSDQAK